MAQDYASSIQGAAVRVSRLASDGSLASGTTASYVMTTFMRVSFTPEFEEGEDITEKGADGLICVSYKTNDTLKRVTLEVAICEPDPEFTEILCGGTILSSTGTSVAVTNKVLTSNVATLTTTSAHGFAVGDTVVVAGVDATFNGTYVVTVVGSATTFSYALVATNVTSTAASGTAAGPVRSVGYAAPLVGVDANPYGAGLEVWSKAIQAGRPAASNPYWQWVFPYVQLRPTGERVVENGLMANVFSGWGTANTQFANGTHHHTASPWAFNTDRPYAYARTATAPVGVKGYVTIT